MNSGASWLASFNFILCHASGYLFLEDKTRRGEPDVAPSSALDRTADALIKYNVHMLTNLYETR